MGGFGGFYGSNRPSGSQSSMVGRTLNRMSGRKIGRMGGGRGGYRPIRRASR